MSDIQKEIEKSAQRQIQKMSNRDILAERERAVDQDPLFRKAKKDHQRIIDEVKNEGYQVAEVILRAMHSREEYIRLRANKKFSQKHIWPMLKAQQKELD